MEETPLTRARLLLGTRAIRAMSGKRVILFGTGGVGSWCAEALVRSGITHLTIVDSDTVSPSNINRQLMATTKTLGKAKVDAMRDRLLEISPDAQIIPIRKQLTPETVDSFNLGSHDYIIDAIDSLRDKAELILRATETEATLFSSMGAALKIDPSKISVAEFWRVRGCPLGAALRRYFRKSGRMPKKKFDCVYSEEVLKNQYDSEDECSSSTLCTANGSLMHITAIFGCRLAGLVIEDIRRSL